MNSENTINTAEQSGHNYSKMEVLFTIVQRGLGERVVEIAGRHGAPVNTIQPGKGTATTEILEMFGIGATEKDIVLSFIPFEKVHDAVHAIANEMEFSRLGTGISFSVPMQSVAGAKVLHYFNTAFAEED